MDSRVLDHNAETGITTYHHFDPITELSHLESVQDVTSIVEANKALASHTPGKEWRHTAQIPLVIYYELKRKGITDDPVAFAKWLDDRDNQVFRIWKGKLGRRSKHR
jgi:hypothetical protein